MGRREEEDKLGDGEGLGRVRRDKNMIKIHESALIKNLKTEKLKIKKIKYV